MTPSSKELLFYPPEVEATITGGELVFSTSVFIWSRKTSALLSLVIPLPSQTVAVLACVFWKCFSSPKCGFKASCPPPLPTALRTESCPGRLVDIVGRAGLFLAGRVSPELQGVEISISERGAAAPLITVATDETGAYRYNGLEFLSLHGRNIVVDDQFRGRR